MQPLEYHEHLLKLAAVVYRSGEDDVDGLLSAFAADQIREGYRVGGVVQHAGQSADNGTPPMQMLDLMSGSLISISRDLGPGAQSCSLDLGGLADAAVAVNRAIAANVELLIVNKFSRQEAEGHGLRAEIGNAVVAGLPVLTAVPTKHYDAWIEFTGGFGTTLVCERPIIDEWWADMARRERRLRTLNQPDQAPGPASSGDVNMLSPAQ